MFKFKFSARKERFRRNSGYKYFGEALVNKARAYGRWILLVHGDGHQFGVSRPFERRAPNIVALEVDGALSMHAVEVLVDPSNPAIFSMHQIINPESPE